MYVRADKKLVFIRVPKTGSTSLMNALRPWDGKPPRQHCMLSEMSDEFVDRYEDWTWVGSIRHPFTWLLSLRACLRVKNHPAMLEQYFYKDGIVPDDWSSFVAELRLTPMDWLEDERITPVVVKQEETENIEQFFGVKMYRMNESASLDHIDLQDGRLAALIEDRFSRELRHYI